MIRKTMMNDDDAGGPAVSSRGGFKKSRDSSRLATWECFKPPTSTPRLLLKDSSPWANASQDSPKKSTSIHWHVDPNSGTPKKDMIYVLISDAFGGYVMSYKGTSSMMDFPAPSCGARSRIRMWQWRRHGLGLVIRIIICCDIFDYDYKVDAPVPYYASLRIIVHPVQPWVRTLLRCPLMPS